MTKKKRARSGKATVKQVNKSAAIRDILTKDPDGKPQGIVRVLADQGVRVSAAFVSQVKLKMKQRVAARKTKRTSSPGIGQFTDTDLMAAKRLVDKIGIEKARAAVELLAKLS